MCVEHSSLSCVKLVKKWNKGYEDSSFTVSTSLKNETTPFPHRVFWLRSRKIQIESFIDLESEPSFHPLCWMQWSLGGMYLNLRHYARGMQTYNKHSFSFQACANMKPNPSKVLHGSSLCKNEPIPNLHLVIAAYPLHFARWALVVSFHRNHLFDWSYAFTWLFILSWGTAVMSGFISQPLDHYMFWAVPPLPELVATLYTTCSSRMSLL